MKISELPPDYRKEADLSILEDETSYYAERLKENPDCLCSAFSWVRSRMGHAFWRKVEGAKSESELPPLNQRKP